MDLDMTRSLSTLVLAALVAGSTPAFANIGPLDLPRLTFPEPSQPTFPDPGQSCTQPGTLTVDRCETDAG
jgi:hypothetical protein